MARREVIVIGASSGGLSALQALVAGLPADLDAAVLIVLHIPVHSRTGLHDLLDRVGPLHVSRAIDGEKLERGRIYVGVEDRHLAIEGGRIRLTRGPRENRVRPSIDVLFRSAALEFGQRVIGVVLSGMLDDGTAGLWAVKDRGGTTVVQEPAQAEYSSMPASALKHVDVDYVLPAQEIGPMIARLVREELPMQSQSPPSQMLKLETQIGLGGYAFRRGVMEMGEPSANTCPECHGVLMKINEGSILRFRCHTGHAFSPKALLADVDESIDNTLWNAVRIIEERALLLRQMEESIRNGQDEGRASEMAEKAAEAERWAQLLHDLVTQNVVRKVES